MNVIRFISTSVLVILALGLSAQWNPDAGIVTPFTENTSTDASSMAQNAHFIVDGDRNTAWESDFVFPFPYLTEPDENILFNSPDSIFCSTTPKDSIFMDSIYLDTIAVDSFFLDTLLVDSIQIDTFMVDSIFMDTIVVDSVGLDTILVDSIFFNATTMMNDTVQVDSIFDVTFMVDSIFYDTLVVDSLSFDTIQVDSIFLDSILVDSMFYDTLSIFINGIDTTNYEVITDGNSNIGNIFIPVNNQYSSIGIVFDSLQPILATSLKIFSQSDVDIYAYTSSTDSVLVGTYVNGVDDYQLKRYEVHDELIQMKLWSTSAINIFEWAALEDYPKESVVVDLGVSQPLGQIITRYWAGENRAAATALYISEDSIDWYELVNLDPNNNELLSIQVDFDTTARYLRLEHSMALLDYGRVFIWEINVYDQYGIYAPYPVAKPSNKTLHELLGMNTLWGWGYNQYTDLIPTGEGPANFDTISGFARNYHFMDWDVPDPDSIPDYSNMPVSGTQPGFEWLDWDREYQAWIDGGVDPHACIMFAHAFAASDWDSVNFSSAYNYGYEFARYFGPTYGNGKIEKMEIGNEPWYYDSTDYRLIMNNMAQGIKAADPAMEVFPCALQAHDKVTENSIIGLKNYIGTRITPADTSYIDGVNIHAYCWDINPLGQRISTPPESIASEFRSINSMIKWRDENMPGKKVIVSEWGYDIDSANEPCVHSECVSERAGAVYTVRASLILHRLGVDEATIFWFANSVDASTTFNRSGLLESVNNNFKKKNAFIALTTLVDSLENAYFHEVIQEDEEAYIYMYADSLGHPTHLVAWSPNSGDATRETDIEWISPDYVPLHATRVIGELEGGTPFTTPLYSNDTMYITVNSAPTIIRLAPNPCVDNLNIAAIDTRSIYTADSTIISNAVLPSTLTDTILYQAGQSITLDNGFCSDGTTTFKANIEECLIDSLLPLMQQSSSSQN